MWDEAVTLDAQLHRRATELMGTSAAIGQAVSEVRELLKPDRDQLAEEEE